MKSFLFVLFASFTTICLAQKHYVYTHTITKDSINFTHQEDMLLHIDENMTTFRSLAGIQRIRKYMGNTSSVYTNSDAEVLSNYTVKRTLSGENLILDRVLGAKMKLYIDFPKSNWNLSSETRTEGEQILHKATICFLNRDWVAWYNPKIPIQEGPHVFSGLPGLIVELYNADKSSHFKLQGQIKDEFSAIELEKNEKTYKEVTIQEFKETVDKAMVNPYQFYITNSTVDTSVLERIMKPERIEKYNEKKRKEFHSILYPNK